MSDICLRRFWRNPGSEGGAREKTLKTMERRGGRGELEGAGGSAYLGELACQRGERDETGREKERVEHGSEAFWVR